MKGVKIQNKKIAKKFSTIYDLHFHKLDEKQQKLILIVIQRYKIYGNSEYYVLFSLIYGCVFFWILWKNDPIISDTDRKKMDLMIQSYYFDCGWEKEKYLDLMIQMDDDFLVLKMSIKYTLLVLGDEYGYIIKNKENYYRSIGWLIPYLTLKESKFLWFFQDFYFKTNYRKEYLETKKTFLDEVSKIELPWEYMIGVVNDLTDTMTKSSSIGIFKVRKKSYFSLYNKMQRKNYNHFSDSIGVRIIFENRLNLKKFIKQFENDFMYMNKKDYIENTKENGYRSVHYKYLSFYRSTEILVELQLRTKKMDEQINTIRSISHFDYTVRTNKWSKLFTEVHEWYDYIMKIIEEKRKK